MFLLLDVYIYVQKYTSIMAVEHDIILLEHKDYKIKKPDEPLSL